jgi:outer membrane protein OmpA-like peptidoglycan-associated protein
MFNLIFIISIVFLIDNLINTKGDGMKKIFFASLFIFSITLNTYADETKGKITLGIKSGVTGYAGDIKQTNLSFFYNLNVGFWFSEKTELDFNYGNGFLHAAQKLGKRHKFEQYFQSRYQDYTLLFKYKLFSARRLNAYLSGGFTVMHINPTDRHGDPLPNLAQDKYNRINWAIPVGCSLFYFLSERLVIESELIYHYAATDYIDDLKKGVRNDGWTTLVMGFSMYFGKPKDSDGDGIPDKIDQDPFHAEDFDGFQDEDGVPDPDNDMDGVPDILDQAPLEAEDRDGFQDADGIPDPDNDKDGIPDIDDKCPGTDENINTKEDFDGFADDDGCPDPDNDNDGILDSLDRCPNEAETFNGYEDDDGCPDEKPEIAVEIGKSIILEGVNFSSASTRINSQSQQILDKVVRTLLSNPTIEIEIRGYTDNRGRYETNVKLSQGRAGSVRDYLIQKGIDGSRISIKGFGPEDPVAPNDTPEDRAKNRRIEFFRTK